MSNLDTFFSYQSLTTNNARVSPLGRGYICDNIRLKVPFVIGVFVMIVRFICANYKIIAHWHEHSLVTPAEQQQLDEHAAKVESLNEKISQQEEQAKQAVRDEATSGEELPEDLTKLFSKEVKEVLEQLRAELKELEGQFPTVAHAMCVIVG